jgi:hypothetical protein
VLNVTVGFAAVDVVGVAVAPKFQEYEVALVELLVNVTGEPEQTIKGVALNAATGGKIAAVPDKTKLYVASSQSFVPKLTLPENVPLVVGLKTTLNVVVAPAATVVVPKVDPKENPAPVTLIGPVKTKLLVPVLVMVKVAVVLVPVLSEPKEYAPPSSTGFVDCVTLISPGVVALNFKLSM